VNQERSILLDDKRRHKDEQSMLQDTNLRRKSDDGSRTLTTANERHENSKEQKETKAT
jgi:hypothetical protein